MIRVLVPAALFLGLCAPSFAAPFCVDDSIGLQVAYGDNYTDEERETFDTMGLRRTGVDATRVERWNGCIRAWVRTPDGREEMRFFQPGTFRPVQ